MTHKMARIFIECIGLDMSEFAERLRLMRESRQLTQVRLAELIEVDPRAYNRWERGTIGFCRNSGVSPKRAAWLPDDQAARL